MKFVDDGEVDDKIVCVPADDRDTGNAYNSLADVPAQLIKQIEFHFNNYKALKTRFNESDSLGRCRRSERSDS